MAVNNRHIDLTTLQEVERLLTSTEFATPDDLAPRDGLTRLATALAPGATAPQPSAAGVEGNAPLPRRR